jgi:hypothetical protein
LIHKICFQAYTDKASILKKSMLTKMVAASRSRPDVLQLYHVFSQLVDAKVATGNRKPRRRLLQEELMAMKKMTKVASGKTTTTEDKIILWLSTQPATVLEKLRTIWSEERAQHSAVPYEILESSYLDPMAENTAAPKNKNPVWHRLLEVTPQKVLLFLDRLAAAFNHRLQQTRDRSKTPNLQAFASHYREDNPELTWRTTCMFEDCLTLQVSTLSQTRRAEIQLMFLRGELQDMLPKAKVMDPNYSAAELRWMKEAEISSANDADLQQALNRTQETNKQSQYAQLELIKLQLQAERMSFLENKARVEEFNEKTLLAAVEIKEAWQQSFDTALLQHLGSLYRVEALGRSSAAAAAGASNTRKHLRPNWFHFHETSLRKAAETPLPEGSPALQAPEDICRINVLSCPALGPQHSILVPDLIHDASIEAALFPTHTSYLNGLFCFDLLLELASFFLFSLDQRSCNKASNDVCPVLHTP